MKKSPNLLDPIIPPMEVSDAVGAGSTLRSKHRSRGFALLVTLLMMVLLVILALGLLSLSTVTLRQAEAGSAMSIARANARLALMMAIGELQKSAGTDKAVTANADLLSTTPAKPNLTGVWSSWDYLKDVSDPTNTTLDYPGQKTKHFQRWLVSDADPMAASAPGYSGTPFAGKTIELVGSGSLGQGTAASQKAQAGRVAVMRDGNPEGAYAWHVADESVKARVASYRNPSLNTSLAKKRALLSGNRPDVSVVKSTDGTMLDFLPKDDTATTFAAANVASGKLVDLPQIGLFASPAPQAGKFRNDVTPYSLGLQTDVRNGGLKKDLTSMFESAALPAEYASKRLYASTGNITDLSDPNWSALMGYYRIYKDVGTSESQAGLPSYRVAPKEKINVNDARFALAAPVNFSPVPVIAKVEVLFTLALRDDHVANRNPGRPYLMHMVATPLVTLYNPYNVALEFDQMQVVVRNVPFGVKCFVNNQPLSADKERIGDMHITATNRGEKSFALDISNWTSPGSEGSRGTITMKPGQSLVCGPYVDPALKFMPNSTSPLFDNGNDAGGVNHMTGAVTPVKSKPGFAGKGVGYDCDYMVPHYNTVPTNPNTHSTNSGCLNIKLSDPADTFHCEFGLLQPTAPAAPNDRLQVYATIQTMQYGGQLFTYTDQLTLDNRFGSSLRYPLTGETPAANFYNSNGLPLVEQANVKTVAILSAYARTSNGGVYETRKRTPGTGVNTLLDGRLPSQPFLFNNPGNAVEQVDLKNDFPGNFSREMNFQPLPGEVEDVFNVSGTRCDMLTGNTSVTGIKSGATFELPSGPMQSISDFRRSNALTTPFPPAFVQPVANSSAAPQLATTAISAKGPTGTTYQMLDHSVLANNSLYDSFYFSTVAPDVGVGADKVFRDFMAGTRALPNQGYQPWLPKGETVDSLVSKCFSGSNPSAIAYQQLGRCQMVKGAFNVNSTRVEAWKAMLSAMSRSEVNVLWAASGQLKAQKSGTVPILPMSMPTGGSNAQIFSAADIDDQRTNLWNGYHELTATEIETLAKCIVDQVRTRGPFLSLSEFVNRRIGPDSEMTRAGALKVAIKKSGINHDATYLSQVLFGSSDFDAKDASGNPLFDYKTKPAAGDNPAEGAPGWVSQGDLMHLLEPAATVRSDTFVVRAYGEATDKNGNVTARAFAEAVVQRTPEFIDPSDDSSVNVFQAGASKSPVNPIFGRRMEVSSFRWLTPSEI